VDSDQYVDGSIDTIHIAADQITNAKIADDQIDSEHYVDGSIDLAHLAADSVNATKIADNAISEEHLDVTAITGHTAETSIADGDLVLIHDASASALKKMTKANFMAGVGSDFTPNFLVFANENLTMATNTQTIVNYNQEVYDSDSAFNVSNFKFTVPSNEGGKYFFYWQVAKNNFSGAGWTTELHVNNTGVVFSQDGGGGDSYATVNATRIQTLSAGDVVHCTATHIDSGNRTTLGNAHSTFWGGYKLV